MWEEFVIVLQRYLKTYVDSLNLWECIRFSDVVVSPFLSAIYICNQLDGKDLYNCQPCSQAAAPVLFFACSMEKRAENLA